MLHIPCQTIFCLFERTAVAAFPTIRVNDAKWQREQRKLAGRHCRDAHCVYCLALLPWRRAKKKRIKNKTNGSLLRRKSLWMARKMCFLFFVHFLNRKIPFRCCRAVGRRFFSAHQRKPRFSFSRKTVALRTCSLVVVVRIAWMWLLVCCHSRCAFMLLLLEDEQHTRIHINIHVYGSVSFASLCIRSAPSGI